ncbi:unnamed protein product [Brassica rapa subsp. trilocularis]
MGVIDIVRYLSPRFEATNDYQPFDKNKNPMRPRSLFQSFYYSPSLDILQSHNFFLRHRSEFLFSTPTGESDKRKMSATQEEDKKPGDQGPAHINLKVKGQDGNEVFFRIKRATQLKKLMTAYCDRQSVDFNSIAFLFDGRRLRAEQTPDELDMEEGDEIDAMLHQTGGVAIC